MDVFDGVVDSSIRQFAEFSTVKHAHKSEILFLENDSAENFYIIYSGNIHITRSNKEGHEMLLTILSVSEYFGDITIIDKVGRATNAVVRENTTLLLVSASFFLNFFHNNSPFSMNLLKNCYKWFRQSLKAVQRLGVYDAKNNVVLSLYHLAEIFGERKGSSVQINKTMKIEEIAQLAGITRERCSKIIKELKEEKTISISDKKIFTLNNYHEM